VRICEPARKAQPEILQFTGMIVTSMNASEEAIFEKLAAPESRAAIVKPVCNVLDDWHEIAPLPSSYRVTKLGWIVEVSLGRGVELNAAGEMEPWQADREWEGLLNREPETVDTANWLLSDSWGIVLNLGGNARGLVVAEDRFRQAINVKGAIWFSELGEAISFIPPSEEEPHRSLTN
jgi:hypothetical protein